MTVARFFGLSPMVMALALLAGCNVRDAAPKGAVVDEAAEIRAIAAILNEGCKAVERRDVDGMIAPFEKNESLRMFDFSVPRSKSYADLRAANAAFVGLVDGPAHCRYTDINTRILSADYAYTVAILESGGKLKTGQDMNLTIRSTDLWKKIDGRWQIVHEHNSLPTDLATGRADLTSAP